MVLKEFVSDLRDHIIKIKDSYVSMDYEEQKQDETELRSTIHQTITAPLKIEYYFWLWFFYSLYSVLKMIIFIPFELVLGIANSVLSILHICLSRYITFFSVVTLIVGYIFQQEQIPILDLSYMYHTFRGQSTLKLYGLIFALEVS